MSAKAVQISLDEELLARIDADPETHQLGRSAVIRRALLLYLRNKRRQQIDNAIVAAYRKDQDELEQEVSELIGAQRWPDE